MGILENMEKRKLERWKIGTKRKDKRIMKSEIAKAKEGKGKRAKGQVRTK
jgi:hypothetical protein